jgi:predicted anti-sigma-YlaC factor YlaD
MGAIELAMGVGLVTAAWRPRLADGLFTFAAVLVGVTITTAVLDTLAGHTLSGSASRHAIELVGVVLLWALPVRRRLTGFGRPRLSPA